MSKKYFTVHKLLSGLAFVIFGENLSTNYYERTGNIFITESGRHGDLPEIRLLNLKKESLRFHGKRVRYASCFPVNPVKFTRKNIPLNTCE